MWNEPRETGCVSSLVGQPNVHEQWIAFLCGAQRHQMGKNCEGRLKVGKGILPHHNLYTSIRKTEMIDKSRLSLRLG